MRRVPQLDGLRAIAILMVFAHHALHVPFLWTGVDLFFVLSGYLITGILLKAKPGRAVGGYWKPFYLRRASRILPPYIGLLAVLAFTFHVPWSHIWYWYAFFGANFALAFGKATVDAMTPLWSLAVEEQFYFLWPWVVLWCSRRSLKRISIAILLFCPLARALCTPYSTLISRSTR
jgi:peptidoglycan/LPS O-acetylase OafA/YrhL